MNDEPFLTIFLLCAAFHFNKRSLCDVIYFPSLPAGIMSVCEEEGESERGGAAGGSSGGFRHQHSGALRSGPEGPRSYSESPLLCLYKCPSLYLINNDFCQ